MDIRLDGKIALVTGASQGVGAAIAEAAARSGAAGLLLTARDAARGGAVAERLRALGPAAHFLPADLAEPDAPARIVRECLDRYGASTSSSTPRGSPTAPPCSTPTSTCGPSSSTSTPAPRSS